MSLVQLLSVIMQPPHHHSYGVADPHPHTWYIRSYRKYIILLYKWISVNIIDTFCFLYKCLTYNFFYKVKVLLFNKFMLLLLILQINEITFSFCFISLLKNVLYPTHAKIYVYIVILILKLPVIVQHILISYNFIIF